ncbi:MAG TPA: hypothetical protein VLF62_03035 [Candidatus Saccharimonadales bacterium]|nr:hypothetical protein [Candidatus Saccharimonadales bacterium]
MRINFRAQTWRSLLSSASLAAAAAYIMTPTWASAASLKVCASSGDACDKFVNKYIGPFILLFTASIGVLAVISYVVAAIQYSSAGDDPGAVNKAKDRAFKTTIGLIAYLLLFAFLNYLIPGGLF